MAIAAPAPLPLPLFEAFNLETDSVENNQGMQGTCRFVTGNLDAENSEPVWTLDAWLTSNNPDSSDDGERADCSLSVSLTYGSRLFAEAKQVQHEYWGDTPGDYLVEAMEDLYEEFIDGISSGAVPLTTDYRLVDSTT